MLCDYFNHCNIKIVDKENIVNHTLHADNLQELLNAGLNTSPIQIMHHASVHYTSRHQQLWKRFLNAYLDIGQTLASSSNRSNSLILCQNGNSERMADTSEIIASGLSSLLMCKWFHAPANHIKEIPNSGKRKRCDFELYADGRKIVFESKGRSRSSDIAAAVNDGKAKKKGCGGDEAYVIACHVPRNGTPTTIEIYDPEPDIYHWSKDHRLYVILNYYRSCAWLSGLSLLATALDSRIAMYQSTGKISREPLELSQNVYKITEEVSVHNHSFCRGRFLLTLSDHSRNKPTLNIKFALSKDIVQYLSEMDEEGICSYRLDTQVLPNFYTSIMETGSLLYIDGDGISSNF